MYTYTTFSLSLPPSQSLVHQKQLSCSARSTAISPDGQLVAVGQTNGEFILFSYSDLSVLAQKRDRSKTVAAVRYERALLANLRREAWFV